MLKKINKDGDVTIKEILIAIVISILIVAFIFYLNRKKFTQFEIQTTNNGSKYKSEFLFEQDGCKMYRFTDEIGRVVYWSNCKGKTEYKSSPKMQRVEQITFEN